MNEKEQMTENVEQEILNEETSVEATEPTTEDEIGRLKEELLRALAETENLRKRAQREKEEALKFAINGFARDLVGAMDNFTRAMEAKPALPDEEALKPVKQFLDGIEMMEKELLGVLSRHGIEKISPLGHKFDHNLHQAMMDIEDAEKEPGTVAQVLQAGYTLNGRLLRPALVAVVKG